MVAVFAREPSERQKMEVEADALKTKLAPLRERAKLDPLVVESDTKVKAAYRAYAQTLREAMIRLDPKSKKEVEREAALRKQLKISTKAKAD